MTAAPFMAWVDIETSGLDPELDFVMEVGIVLTTPGLDVLSSIALPVYDHPRRTEQRIDGNRYVLDMHTRSGLLAEVRTDGRPAPAVEADLLSWLTCETTGYPEIPTTLGPMCGSSVHFDRAFLARHMPKLAAEWTYRNLDVSGIREAARLWAPHLLETLPPEQKLHRALPDLEDTLALARYFKGRLFGGTA